MENNEKNDETTTAKPINDDLIKKITQNKKLLAIICAVVIILIILIISVVACSNGENKLNNSSETVAIVGGKKITYGEVHKLAPIVAFVNYDFAYFNTPTSATALQTEMRTKDFLVDEEIIKQYFKKNKAKDSSSTLNTEDILNGIITASEDAKKIYKEEKIDEKLLQRYIDYKYKLAQSFTNVFQDQVKKPKESEIKKEYEEQKKMMGKTPIQPYSDLKENLIMQIKYKKAIELRDKFKESLNIEEFDFTTIFNKVNGYK